MKIKNMPANKLRRKLIANKRDLFSDESLALIQQARQQRSKIDRVARPGRVVRHA